MKILVGYDESNVSKSAVDLAIKQAKAFKGKIYLVYSLIELADQDYDRIEKAKVKAALETLEKYVRDAGIDCEGHLLIRDLEPGEDLVEFAKEHQIDQIVIGVKRRSKLGKALFGSTAQHVVLHAPCPVLTVK